MSDRIGFEREISFPTHPMEASRVFLGVMAYPELGAGQPGRLGFAFADAMRRRMIWSRRKAKGLRTIRAEFDDANFKPPELRDFEGAYFRGQRRLRRRSVAYSIVGSQLVDGFFSVRQASDESASTGQNSYTSTSAELWKRDLKSPRQIIGSDLDRWSKKLGLNATGKSADSIRKQKDLMRRAYLPSRPVLHMAHAFNRACADVGPGLPGWGEGDFMLIMLINSESWINDVIDEAMRWRDSKYHLLTTGLRPEHMIKLTRQKPAR